MKTGKRIADIHAHILPGVDDGAKDIEEALEMLRIACREGITDMIVTPHYQSGRFFTPGDVLREKTAGLQSLVEQEGIPIRLYPGTEIYFRSGLEERLETRQLATMNGSEFVLVEFSPVEEFSYMRNALEELFGLGYHPILAHVERYRCMREDRKRVKELRGMGCGIQANAGSIAGEYGYLTGSYLHQLLKEQLVDYVGTDAHSAIHRTPRMKKCAERLYRKYGEEYAERLLYKNAESDLLKKNAKEEPKDD